ncbi:MAG: iron-sulfur cluster assembly accessory protein [Alphaproteobacteria bacterium]|nr:iron-sulfur cluster assembly accessory protein [Alphaproteobacteria bacterium]MBF0128750.1 iron-sulfur cluster assembly accessory protein [Alphaproteobacteria bacterium]
MLTLTEKAVDAVRSAMAGAANKPTGMRVMVQSGGCSGLRYALALEAEARADDHVVEFGEVKVLIDPDSRPLLTGVVIDFVSTLEGAGFTFDNPNATEKCGCGKSFC